MVTGKSVENFIDVKDIQPYLKGTSVEVNFEIQAVPVNEADRTKIPAFCHGCPLLKERANLRGILASMAFREDRRLQAELAECTGYKNDYNKGVVATLILSCDSSVWQGVNLILQTSSDRNKDSLVCYY